MHPFRPSPKVPAFDLPLWTKRLAVAVLWATFISVPIGGFGVGLATTGCSQVQAAFPVLQAIEQTVLADLEQNKTDAQIASDVCGDLGGSSLTDAVCGTVETLVQDAIDLLIAGNYLSPAALQNAHAYQARHPRPPAPATSAGAVR